MGKGWGEGLESWVWEKREDWWVGFGDNGGERMREVRKRMVLLGFLGGKGEEMVRI
jgi:hypothetical protein